MVESDRWTVVVYGAMRKRLRKEVRSDRWTATGGRWLYVLLATGLTERRERERCKEETKSCG